MVELAGGLTLGVALGWILQRGGFCMNSAFRSLLFEKDKSILQAWLLVIAINIPVLALLQDLGFIYPQIAPLFWPALIIGGTVFGIGMVIAGGCASGTYYRAGRGMLGSWAALVGFLFGTAAMDGGVLVFFQHYLRRPTLEIRGREPTVFTLLGVEQGIGRWIVITVLVGSIGWYLLQAPKQKFVFGWGWKKTGFLVGLVSLATWILSALVGRDYGLSFTQPSVALVRLITTGDGSGVGLPFYMLLGVPLGSFYSAYRKGEAAWSVPDSKTLVRQAGGGITMGLGAALAGGCNIGHGITGLATLGLGSILGVFSIMVGCWIMTGFIMGSHRVRAVS